jgi:hypothetical protein
MYNLHMSDRSIRFKKSELINQKHVILWSLYLIMIPIFSWSYISSHLWIKFHILISQISHCADKRIGTQ